MRYYVRRAECSAWRVASARLMLVLFTEGRLCARRCPTWPGGRTPLCSGRGLEAFPGDRRFLPQARAGTPAGGSCDISPGTGKDGPVYFVFIAALGKIPVSYLLLSVFNGGWFALCPRGLFKIFLKLIMK